MDASVSISYDGDRIYLRCGECRSKFSPGVGKPIPTTCLGCRATYVFTRHVRDLIARATETASCPQCDRPIRRRAERGRRTGDWECATCCLAWPDTPAAAS